MKKRLLCLILACLLLTTGVLAYGSGTGETYIFSSQDAAAFDLLGITHSV